MYFVLPPLLISYLQQKLLRIHFQVPCQTLKYPALLHISGVVLQMFPETQKCIHRRLTQFRFLCIFSDTF